MPDIVFRVLGMITAVLVWILFIWGWRESRKDQPPDSVLRGARAVKRPQP